jgi:long-chain acyl-CoA synthetase
MSENVGAALERAGKLFAEREAVVDGRLRWSYRVLRRRVAAFDAALDGLGLARGDVVAVLGLNSAFHFVAWLGIPRSGRVTCGLNVRLAPAELAFILRDSGARALVVDDAFLEVGRELARTCERVEHLIYMGAGTTPDGCVSFAEMTDGDGRPPAAVDAEQVAGIYYTGGTTGRPKGVMLTHRNLVANAKHALIALGYRQRDSYLHAAPMFHVADANANVALTWVGGRHVFIPSFDPELWPATVEAEGVTQGVLVPTMVNMLVNHPALTAHELGSLDQIVYAGSPMPQELLRRAMELLPCGWAQSYGMTEAAPIVTYLSPEEHRGGDQCLRSAGRPVVGVEAEVRRPDLSVAKVGEPGEVWVRGPNVMKGYWNRPKETAEALDLDGWYRTGDAAYQDTEGYLYIVDRVKDMIVSGGENVYSSEVEDAIQHHPAVLEGAVFAVPDERLGERVHAAIVLRPGADADETEIVEHCRALIAGYKLPRSIEFHDQPLPKSGAGKVLKRELRRLHWAGRERQVS